MAYRSHHCSATLRCSVCISVFCTLLALSVLLPFMLSIAMSLQCTIPLLYISITVLCLLLHTSITPNSHPRSLLFCILIVSVLLVHAICAKLLHALTLPQFSPSGCLLALHSAIAFLTPAFTSLTLLHFLLMSSTLPDHHCNSSASLAVHPTHPASLGVMLRFLSLSGS
jgi:hypothetical protein